MSEFNPEMTNSCLEEFCAPTNLKNLIKQLTFFKNPTRIDDNLTNHPKNFHLSSFFDRFV